jgi:hypothetical protein
MKALMTDAEKIEAVWFRGRLQADFRDGRHWRIAVPRSIQEPVSEALEFHAAEFWLERWQRAPGVYFNEVHGRLNGTTIVVERQPA